MKSAPALPQSAQMPVAAAGIATEDRETFHEGERAVQARAGVRERLRQLGPQVIRDYMPEQHRQFFTQLPFLLAGSTDAHDQPWVSVLVGKPGFVSSPAERRLRIQARPLAGDPLSPGWPGRRSGGIAPGMAIGLLGIEPHTRRRNRMNGVVDAIDAGGFEVTVQQSFGNCPKYIQARKPEYLPARATQHAAAVQEASRLDLAARALVQRADTFFIASAHPSGAVDVSHRGGPPGFLRIRDDGLLVVPDYAGNNFFNTLGNLVVNPRAGLLFIDYETGDCLHLAVRATIDWDPVETAAVAGAKRLLRLEVIRVRRVQAWLPLRWGRVEMSPHLPRGVATALPAAAASDRQ